jgi:orotidine-5'-phosphate decarboxylase
MTKIIVAIKGNSYEKLKPYIPELSKLVWGFKVNDLRYNADTIKTLYDLGGVMVDAKIYEIPEDQENEIMRFNTCADIITVHISSAFIKQGEVNFDTLAGVTVLTSMNESTCKFVYNDSRVNVVEKFIQFAIDNNYGHIVCSGADIKNPNIFKMIMDSNIKTICPGIRMNDKLQVTNDDQSFVITPKEAVILGIDYIVIGRPISQAPDPIDAVKRILDELVI